MGPHQRESQQHHDDLQVLTLLLNKFGESGRKALPQMLMWLGSFAGRGWWKPWLLGEGLTGLLC